MKRNLPRKEKKNLDPKSAPKIRQSRSLVFQRENFSTSNHYDLHVIIIEF